VIGEFQPSTEELVIVGTTVLAALVAIILGAVVGGVGVVVVADQLNPSAATVSNQVTPMATAPYYGSR
jgi:hypothetical protein